MVARGEHGRYDIAIHGHFTLTQHVEKALRHMSERHYVVQPEQTGRTLDGMSGAKNGVEAFVLIVLLFQTQQDILHLLEQFAAFRHIGSQCGVMVHVFLLWSQKASPGY